MADALELRLDVGGGGDIAVGEMAEVELHAGLEAPVERHLVDRPGRARPRSSSDGSATARRDACRCGSRAATRSTAQPLPVRQVLLLQARERTAGSAAALCSWSMYSIDGPGPAGRPGRRSAAARKYRSGVAPSFPPLAKFSRVSSALAARPCCVRTPIRSTCELDRRRRFRGSGRSPARSNCRPCPEPKTSPAWIVSSCDASAMNLLEGEQHFAGVALARVSPLTRTSTLSVWGSPSSSAVTIQGPSTLEPSKLLPLAGPSRPCISSACRSRAEKSLKIV